MININNKQYIYLSRELDEKTYKEIKTLEELCINRDNISLKLELDYKISIRKSEEGSCKIINEFLYYAGDLLVGYLGIGCFNGCEAEINGMVHPDWRRKGIFSKLYELAKDECTRRNFNKILLLCDDKAKEAKALMEKLQTQYSFSEYKMMLVESNKNIYKESISLRKAKNSDAEEIARLNCVLFGDPNIQISYPEEEEKENNITYIIELQSKVIGKIRVEGDGDLAYIYGFGLFPEYRGNGYGRAALAETLKLINENNIRDVYLDVAVNNTRALNLYKSCGFEEQAVMNYYEQK